jgi:TusA-related sulfurtransferase
VIRADDRVARVLERDERLLDVFVAVSPHFARLRDSRKRRLMARLVTVAQAARIAGVDPAILLAELNRAAGSPDGEPATLEPEPEKVMTDTLEIPSHLRDIPTARIVDLDVRDDLRNGIEPFQQIMMAVRSLGPDAVFRLRAIFEPVPLYHVLARQGFSHWTESFAPDDWRVWFFREEPKPAPGTEEIAPTATGEASPEQAADEAVVVLDVRGLEPPEPMVRTLAALERLEPGQTLMQINVRVPQFLLPKLSELGYRYEVREQNEELVRLFIRRA